MVKIWNQIAIWISKVSGEFGVYIGKVGAILIQAAFATILAFLTGKHGLAMMAFITLITADWLTKRYAVCRRYVADHCDVPIDEVDSRTAFKAWNEARGEGYWQSSKMRSGSSKLMTYMIGVGVAALVDVLTGHVAGNDIFTNIVLCYFGLTEAESILENLKEAGVGKAAEVCEIIEKKKAQYLGVNAVKKEIFNDDKRNSVPKG